MKCFNELETIKFTPKLNHKETEQTHKDFKTLKRRRGKKQKDLEEIDSYYVNIVEELNDFNDWCISDNNLWGIPIPFFTFKDTGNILVD
jgi:isoleucyl-tRNA synthetase